MADMDKISKLISGASMEEIAEIQATLDEAKNEFKKELAKQITLGKTVKYGEGREGTVESIIQQGVIITAPELKKRRTLLWTDIESVL